MKRFKKNGRIFKASNAIDPARSTNKSWGFHPVPNKGGATTNFEIPADMFIRELGEYLLNGGVVNA